MPKKSTVRVVQDEENPVPAEILADALVAISDSMRRLHNTRLTRKAVVALIHDHSKVNKGTIEVVLSNLERLEEIWLKKKVA